MAAEVSFIVSIKPLAFPAPSAEDISPAYPQTVTCHAPLTVANLIETDSSVCDSAPACRDFCHGSPSIEKSSTTRGPLSSDHARKTLFQSFLDL